jgi:tRNA nucleotidyltransferase/poly(A) polymerase
MAKINKRNMLPEQLEGVLNYLKTQEWIQKLARNAELYVVGGIVRDAYLNKESKDVDIIVDGLSINGILKTLKPYGRASLEGESFSVIKFRPKGWEGEDYDIAIPREDRKIGEGHKGFEIITDGVDVNGDLKRRDFTINSMAANIMTGELLDPFNGQKDLKARKIKATDPTAFVEDPLRILRGIQFATRFGFDIERKTLKMMKDNADLIKQITGERLLTEFDKIITKGNTQLGLELLHKTDVDKALFDKKMLKYDEGFEYLDAVSFYYMLALLGDVDPYTFYMKKLKGKLEVGNAIKILDNLIGKWYGASEEDKLYMVMNAITKIPRLDNIALLPPEASDIVMEMMRNRIPMTKADVPVTGDDVMMIFNIPRSKEVGDILDKMYKDALMNKFNWKDRNDTIDYLSQLK